MTVSQAIDPVRKQSRRFTRFSLRTLLILVTLLCAWLAVVTNRASRQKRAVEAISAHGGEFNYDYQRQTSRNPFTGRPSLDSYSMKATPPGPPWLRSLLGEHYFITPVCLRASDQRIIDDDGLAYLENLPELTNVSIGGVGLHDGDLAHFRHLTKLRLLSLRDTLPQNTSPRDFGFLRYCTALESISTRDADFGDDAVKQLNSPILKTLFLYYTSVGDDGVAHLSECESLEKLGLAGTKITDAGIKHLVSLPKLEYLSLSKTAITNASVESFKKMTHLQALELIKTEIDDAGAAEIQAALPQCRIVH